MITKQALGNTLFGMADILRDKVEDYKAYILSLLFFKFNGIFHKRFFNESILPER